MIKKMMILVLCSFVAHSVFAELLIKSGESIAFLGDSITQFGARQPSGYVNEVISGFKANGIEVKSFPAGISGHKSNQMLARLDKVIANNPTWMTLSCGVNDVWHGSNGVALGDYTTNILAIVEQTQAAGIKVMILTSTMIREDETNTLNIKLDKYNDALNKIAAEKGCVLVDLNKDMKTILRNVSPKKKKINANILTVDGVHMDIDGNMMMAKGVLRGFGLNQEMIEKAGKYWLQIPNAYSLKNLKVSRLSVSEKRRLDIIAAEQGMTCNQMLSNEVNQYIQELLKK
jgi:lysophospholipase L1-like esterase